MENEKKGKNKDWLDIYTCNIFLHMLDLLETKPSKYQHIEENKHIEEIATYRRIINFILKVHGN